MAFKGVIALNTMIQTHVNPVNFLNYIHQIFFKILFLNFFPNNSSCNFNFIGKTVPFPSTDIIAVAIICFSSDFFFPQKGVIFSFCELLFKKFVKLKCKTLFRKITYGLYLLHLCNIRLSKARAFQKYIPEKNKRLHRLWRSSNTISAYKQVFRKHISAYNPNLINFSRCIKYLFVIFVNEESFFQE